MEQQMPMANKNGHAEQEKVYEQKRLRRAMRKRQAASARKTAPGSGRAPSRTRTGTTPHFALWQADLKLKSALQRIKLDALAESGEDPKAATGFALLYIHGVKNVFTLTQKRTDQLLRARGIEIDHLEAIEKYLLGRNVKPAWTVY